MALREPQTGITTQSDAFVAEFPAVPQSVGSARAAVSELAQRHGIRDVRLDDIRLAVSEAATNVVIHAYPAGERPGTFRITAAATGAQLEIVIEDDGCGLDAPTPNSGLGMGVKLMDKICQSMQMRARESGGTTVRLCFALGD